MKGIRERNHGEQALLDPEEKSSKAFPGFTRIAEALRASEERYRTYLGLSTEGMGRVEFDEPLSVHLPEDEQIDLFYRHARIAEANDVLAQSIGHACGAEIVGRKLADLVPRDTEDARRFIRSGYRQTDEYILRRGRDGAERWIRRNSIGIVKGGALTGIWITNRDETARQRAEIEAGRARQASQRHEHSMSEQRAFLRQVIDINPHLIFAKDRDGRFTLVNQALAELTGKTVEDLEGKLDSELDLPREEIERYRGEDVGVMASGRETRIPQGATTDATGALRWFETVKRPLVGRDGEVTQVLSVATEITGRIRADEERAKLVRALEDAAREWTESFDAVDAGVVLTGPDGEIMRLNRKALELIAGDAHYRSFLGHRLETISPSEPWRSAAEERRNAARELVPCARQVRDEATGRRWYLLASPMLRGESTSPWVIVTMRDVTIQVELEEQLRRARHMEAMGTLVAAVAHEVRNPLFGITATLDSLEASLGMRPEYQEGAALLHSQVTRLTHLMNDLLDYGKPDVPRLSRGGIDDVVRRAIRACVALADRMGVTVTTELAESPVLVSRDPARLEQVFQNLVANAVQISPPGGTVRVAVRPATGQPPGLYCTVEDEGPGIAEGDFTRIFEPFVSRRKGGTGLGLSIVQRIVEAHGGRVTAANRAEGGAIFAVTLPA